MEIEMKDVVIYYRERIDPSTEFWFYRGCEAERVMTVDYLSNL